MARNFTFKTMATSLSWQFLHRSTKELLFGFVLLTENGPPNPNPIRYSIYLAYLKIIVILVKRRRFFSQKTQIKLFQCRCSLSQSKQTWVAVGCSASQLSTTRFSRKIWQLMRREPADLRYRGAQEVSELLQKSICRKTFAERQLKKSICKTTFAEEHLQKNM